MTTKVRECFECGRKSPRGGMYRAELYDTPWDDVPRIKYLCKVAPKQLSARYHIESCHDLVEDESWADFRYFWCECCGRQVCRQNPRNGWHSQVRIINECEEICLQCYEKHILGNGVDREEFEQGHLLGMFFSHGNPEPLEVGYRVVADHAFIGNNEAAKRLCEQAIELINSGEQVVVGYESMAIGGLEGTVSLFSKAS